MVSKNWPERPVDNESFRPPRRDIKLLLLLFWPSSRLKRKSRWFCSWAALQDGQQEDNYVPKWPRVGSIIDERAKAEHWTISNYKTILSHISSAAVIVDRSESLALLFPISLGGLRRVLWPDKSHQSVFSALSLSPFLLSKTTKLLHFHSFPRRPLCGCLAKVKLQFQLYWKLIIIQVLTHLSPPTMCVASGHFICSYYKHSSVIRNLFQSHPQSNRCASLLFPILPPTCSTHSSSYLKFHWTLSLDCAASHWWSAPCCTPRSDHLRCLHCLCHRFLRRHCNCYCTGGWTRDYSAASSYCLSWP